MSKVHFVTTKFEDLSTGKVSWGFRISDGYDSDFDNSFTEEEARAITAGDAISIICDYPIEEYGFFFNNTWIDAEDIKAAFNPE